MEGVTHFPMRLWLAMVSQPKSMTSPFLRVTRAFPEHALPELFVPELFGLRGLLPHDYALVPQFIAGSPDCFLRATDLIPHDRSPMIELNCGCPSPNSLGKHAGSGLLADPELFRGTITRLAAHLGPGRLALKMRLGLASDDEFPALLDAVAGLPLGRLTIHARTRADGYRSHARWPLIAAALTKTKVPIVASGDVWGLDSAAALRTMAPGLHGIMIGRGLLRNPWIFREIDHGQAVTIATPTFINVLFAYLMIQDLAQRAAPTLLAKVAQQRIGRPCGTDAAAWAAQTAALSKVALGRPMLLHQQATPDLEQLNTLSPVAFQRLRFLWSYLRTSLPEAYADSRLGKARSAQEFFTGLLGLSAGGGDLAPLTLRHRPEWDDHFARARG